MRSSSRVLLAVVAATLTTLTAAPAGASTANSFIDDDNSRFEAFIETAQENGLITGCNPPRNDQVCPSLPVTRGTMAVMVARAVGAEPSSTDHSTDDDGLGAEAYIDALLDRGVRMRCGEEQVCPQRPVTRADMAAMISDAFGWKAKTNSSQYADIGDERFEKELAQLAHRGGLTACDPPINRRLCPRQFVRRDEAVFALVTAMGLAPAETTAKGQDERPLGFGDSFDELSLWDGRLPSSRNRVSLTNGGYEGTALRVRIPAGSHFGADFHLHLKDAVERTPEELFFRYYLRLDPDWDSRSSGKLPGFSGVYGGTGKGGYQSRPSAPGWSARLMFSPKSESDGRVWLGYYVYHLGQETRYGDGFGWNQAGRLQPGEWYCLEGSVHLNKPGLADGSLRAWVDGTPAFDRSGLEFRRSGEPNIKIESFWFDVYYGGKSVAPNDLGLTIDEVMVDTQRVGCGGDRKVDLGTTGDLDGDGYLDRVVFGECPGGTCFTVGRGTWSGESVTRRNGDGAWFTLDTYRLGLSSGDVDGDGRDEIVYHGRCDTSKLCWRVHDILGNATTPQNWGDGARFSNSTNVVVMGDWNGDGLDDLLYRGLCGDEGRDCWRVHPSSGSGFGTPANWGDPPTGVMSVQAADVTGDGLEDLVYIAPCDESRCWFAQMSQGKSFSRPVALGPALEGTGSNILWVDFNGDDTSDMVSWINSADRSWLEARFMSRHRLSDPVTMKSFTRHIDDVSIRVLGGSTVQAVVQLACGGGESCLQHLMAATPGRLVASERFRDVRWDRPGAPRIT